MADRPGDRVTVSVVRSGGVAGIRRAWSLEADGERGAELAALGGAASWVEPAVDPRRRDGIVWTVTMTGDGAERRVRMPESALDEPLRRLVDTVRDQGTPDAPARGGAS